jgi:hypothetical protein
LQILKNDQTNENYLGLITFVNLDSGEHENLKFESILSDVLYCGNQFITDGILYNISYEVEYETELDLVDLIQRNSPLDKLRVKISKSPNKKVDPKRVLFHEKVKSSSYGNQVTPRKMFKPVLATRRKSKSKKIQKIKLSNFDVPIGELEKTEKKIFQDLPSVLLPSNSGKFIIAVGSDVLSLSENYTVKPIAAISVPVSDLGR